MWVQSEKLIQEHNDDNNRKSSQGYGGEFKWKMAHSRFSDWTIAEKQKLFGAKLENSDIKERSNMIPLNLKQNVVNNEKTHN
jgi:hypothetical protein